MSTRTPTRPKPRAATERFEKRRRSVSRRRWLLRGAALGVAALLGLAVWLVGWSSVLGVRQVVVRGADQVQPSLVQLKAAVRLGTPLARVDLGAVRARVEAIPAVASAQVRRQWPNTLLVQVVVRVPVLAANSGGRWQLIDRTGVAFKTVAAPPAGLPVLTTAGDPATVDRPTLRAMATVAASLPATLAAQVRSIGATSPDDVVLRLASGAQVRWGSADDTAVKAQVLAVLVARVGGPKVSLYDVRAPAAPTTR
jgi:cell division protein FtsQ